MFSNISFYYTFVRDFVREMSEKDKKVNSLVDNRLFKDEANMAITRCSITPFKIVAFMFIFR